MHLDHVLSKLYLELQSAAHDMVKINAILERVPTRPDAYMREFIWANKQMKTNIYADTPLRHWALLIAPHLIPGMLGVDIIIAYNGAKKRLEATSANMYVIMEGTENPVSTAMLPPLGAAQQRWYIENNK